MAATASTPFNPSAPPCALHLKDDAAWDAALAARDAAPAPRCAQDIVNGMFVAAREWSRTRGAMGERMTKDDILHIAVGQRGSAPYPTQAQLDRAWKWCKEQGMLRTGKHLASRRSFNLTPYYVWV